MGRGSELLDFGGGPADDGKRFYSDGRFMIARKLYLLKWGGGLGEGWLASGPGPEVGGFIFQCLLTGKSSVKNITFSSLSGNFLNGLLVPRYQVNRKSPVKSLTENFPLRLNGLFSVELLTGDSPLTW